MGLLGWLTLLFWWTLSPLAGYDFWFYLAVGKEIWESGQIPWSQSYLGTTSTLGFGRYADVAWLANLLCYLVYLLGGFAGLVLLKSFLLSATAGLVYLGCRLAGLVPYWAAAWSTLGLWTIRGRFEMRTYLFTDLCLAALVVLLILAERQGRLSRATLAATMVLFTGWSNLHQGILAGWVVLGCWLLLGAVPLKSRVALFVGALAASLVRPNALAFPSFLIDHFTNSQAITGVVEWAAPGRELLLYQLGPMYLALLALTIAAIRRRRGGEALPSWFFAVTALFFTWLATRSIRSMSELLPVVFPLAAAYSPPLSRATRVRGLVALALTLMLWGSFQPADWSALKRADGYPEGLLSALPPKGQLFNSFEFGNFLVFRGVPPFLHGMTGLYSETLIENFLDVLNPTPRRWDILREYGVTAALLHLPELTGDATLNLVETLAEAPDWKLELWDDTGLLFLRGPREQGLIQVRPWRSPPWQDEAAAEEELRGLVQRRPSAMAHRFLSDLLLRRGETEQALEQARQAVEQAPYFYPAWVQLGLCYAKSGNLDGMLEASREALRVAPNLAAAHFNLGLALWQKSTTQSGLSAGWNRWRAWYHARRALWLDSTFPPARQLLQSL
jgi:tetratricopeptide (TPR) repeat protein